MRAWPAVSTMMAAAAAAVASTSAAAATPSAVAAEVAAAAVGRFSHLHSAAVRGSAEEQTTTSFVCIKQSNLNQLSAVTAEAMASIGVPPPLLDRWVHIVTVRMPAELGMADPDPPAAVDPADVRPVRGGKSLGGDDDDDSGGAERDGFAYNDDKDGGGSHMEAEGLTDAAAASIDDRRCYVPDDAVEFIVSSFSAILDEAGVVDNAATEAATVTEPSSIALKGGVCRSCCALLAIEARFLKVIRRCACRRCHCHYDCR